MENAVQILDYLIYENYVTLQPYQYKGKIDV